MRLPIVLILLLALAGSFAEPAQAETTDARARIEAEIARLNQQVVQLYGQGRYGEADIVAKRSLDLTEKKLGPDHPDTATNLNNLALLYQAQGAYAAAAPLHKRALAIREKALGPDHSDTAESINNLAELYRAQGDYAAAAPLHKRALAIREKALGPDHSDTAESINNLAGLYKEQGDHAAAAPLLKRALAINEKALGPSHPNTATSLNNLALLYRAQGDYAATAPLLKRALAIREKALGPDHPDTATSLNNLAGLHAAQGDHAAAAPLLKRALAIREKALGPDHPSTARSLNNLAELYRAQGDYAAAAPLLKRALAISEKALGPDHPDTANSLNNLALLYQAQGDHAAAAPLFRRALAIKEKALGPSHPDTATSLSNLAGLYMTQGDYAAAAPLFKRALAIREKALGPDHPSTAESFNHLAGLYKEQGDHAAAAPLHKRALAIREKALGPDHPDTATSLNNLALLYQAQGDYAAAAPLLKRALAIFEKALGPSHPDTATSLSNLAELYRAQGDDAATAPLLKRALAIREKALGPDHPDTATSLNNLAGLHAAQGDHAAAAPLLKRALAIREKALGPDHPDTATSLNNLAGLYWAQGDYAAAAPLLKRALAIFEKALGPGHPLTATSLSNLSALYYAQGDWAQASAHMLRSTAVIARRSRRDGGAGEVGGIGGPMRSEAARSGFAFSLLVKAAWRHAGEKAAAGMFATAQWAVQSEAAAALAQSAARLGAGSGELALLVRERQDKVKLWQALEQRVNKLRGEAKQDARLEREMAAIEARIDEIDTRFAKDFPDYAALASPEPLALEAVQKLLGADEALILLLVTPKWAQTPEESFVWVVTREKAEWHRAKPGTALLQGEVAALRCGLDRALWLDAASAERCRSLTGMGYDADELLAWEAGQPGSTPLPFDLARAHRLYRELLGGVEDLLKRPDGAPRKLIVVPTGALSQLPFQVLVTSLPAGVSAETPLPFAPGADVPWLGARHAITMLPAVSSLKALRHDARPSRAARPLIAFANPLLDGDSKRIKDAELAKAAREKQACPAPDTVTEAAPHNPGQRLAGLPLAGVLFRGGSVDVAQVRKLSPLPETTDEACRIARAADAKDADLWIGARATEGNLKRLSRRGELARYRVLHLATHGLVAGGFGELQKSLAEAAIVLTPPSPGASAESLAEDDGLLTASEVTTLKLDADWVILSACNTAAGNATSAEALSGLARAFFYAGGRALLVSHWEVNSAAAVDLVTGAFGALKYEPGIGRAEAHRRAIMATMSRGGVKTHPAIWAPFVVVGEGEERHVSTRY